MLDRNKIRGREQEVMREVEKIMSNTDDPKESRKRAIESLSYAVLENPECEALRKHLRELASTHNSPEETHQDVPEVREHRQALAGSEAILSVLEKRIRGNRINNNTTKKKQSGT